MPNEKFFKNVSVNGQPLNAKAYIDFGSQWIIIRQKEAVELKLLMKEEQKPTLKAYGGIHSVSIPTLGTTSFQLQIDEVCAEVPAVVVADNVQKFPLLVGQPFTEQPGIEARKTDSNLNFFWQTGGQEKEDEPKGGEVYLIEAPTPFDFENLHVEGTNEEIARDLKNQLITHHRHQFACNYSELGRAKDVEMKIRLFDNTPFSTRAYRLAKAENDILESIIEELLQYGLIRESNSCYASPALLVGKKDGDLRMCVDYRKLNSRTIKYNYPLPRIDEMIDRLTGAKFLHLIDLKTGYHLMGMEEESKPLTSFVSQKGQFEFNVMPFGLTNAPRTFQHYMNRVLKPVQHIAAVYLDDIIVHASTEEESQERLFKVLKVLEEYNLSLNPKKCHFNVQGGTVLGFEISDGHVKPGRQKLEAVAKFPRPTTIKNIRQFMGLTGYFRHFVKNYAGIAKPLTSLLKRDRVWYWGNDEEEAFQELKAALTSCPVLALYNPEAETEVHTDASALGLAGMILQRQSDGKFHPIAYFSRQTTAAEANYHSYELEMLAVVETTCKYRNYLLNKKFTIVTDCNAITTCKTQKELVRRIYRWWVYMSEFDYDVRHRPGEKMQHVDALSRNPPSVADENFVLQIEAEDWVLSAQNTDPQLVKIRETLSRHPKTAEDKIIHRDYHLQQDRIYHKSSRGLLWAVPRSMRHQIVKSAHEGANHGGAEKTLQKLNEAYWFPRMRKYVDRFVKCCIPCLFAKRKGGKQEGLLNPIPKGKVPLKTMHVDHLGPFPLSPRRNQHLIVAVDAFTKFTFMRAVRTTDAKAVIEYLRDLFATYGTPERIVTDRGPAFKSRKFKAFCNQNSITHIKVAVATARANGQVERLNQAVKHGLLTTAEEENKWDEEVRRVQFAINNTVNQSTKRTPSQLLLGYTPRGGDDAALRDEVQLTSTVIDDLLAEREEAMKEIEKSQSRQKEYYDRSRRTAEKYQEGDLVMLKRAALRDQPGSQKMKRLFRGPYVVKKVLPNDRYIIKVIGQSGRRDEGTWAADRLKRVGDPATDDESSTDSGSDGEDDCSPTNHRNQ